MKNYFISLFLALPLCAMAQVEIPVAEIVSLDEMTDTLVSEEPGENCPEMRFGIVNKTAVLEAMPEYAKVDEEMEALKESFDTEAKRSADEFNAKYESFLNEQRNYAPSIMRKRQAELEEMMRTNESFRVESRRMLREAREKALEPLRTRINEVIAAVAEENNLLFVLNGDKDAVPYFNNMVGMDITDLVKEKCQ